MAKLTLTNWRDRFGCPYTETLELEVAVLARFHDGQKQVIHFETKDDIDLKDTLAYTRGSRKHTFSNATVYEYGVDAKFVTIKEDLL